MAQARVTKAGPVLLVSAGEAPRRVHFFVGWVYAPWGAASLVGLLALRLLVADTFGLHSHGWGLLGSAAICFSIGCVCKVSWSLARLNQARTAASR